MLGECAARHTYNVALVSSSTGLCKGFPGFCEADHRSPRCCSLTLTPPNRLHPGGRYRRWTGGRGRGGKGGLTLDNVTVDPAFALPSCKIFHGRRPRRNRMETAPWRLEGPGQNDRRICVSFDGDKRSPFPHQEVSGILRHVRRPGNCLLETVAQTFRRLQKDEMGARFALASCQ